MKYFVAVAYNININGVIHTGFFSEVVQANLKFTNDLVKQVFEYLKEKYLDREICIINIQKMED